MSGNKTDYIQIRISPELKQALADAAKKDNRTMSNYIECLIRKELNDNNKK